MAGAVTTLDSVIKEYLSGRGDTSKHGYTRFLQIAISGLKEMNYDVSGMPEYLDVSLGDDMTIPIPPDCINVIGIHFNYGGRWISSAKEKYLAIGVDYSCGTEDKHPNKDINGTDYYYERNFYGNESHISTHFRNGQPTGGYFNNKGGNPYTFRINNQLGVIELSTNHPTNIIFEYLPTAKTVNGKHEIHPFLVEPLLAWLNYADVRFKRNVSKALINDLERTYVLKKTRAKKRFDAFTKEDFLNSIRKGYSAVDKF